MGSDSVCSGVLWLAVLCPIEGDDRMKRLSGWWFLIVWCSFIAAVYLGSIFFLGLYVLKNHEVLKYLSVPAVMIGYTVIAFKFDLGTKILTLLFPNDSTWKEQGND